MFYSYLKHPIRKKYRFCHLTKNNKECKFIIVHHMCTKRAKREKWSAVGRGWKDGVKSSRSIWILPDRLFWYSKFCLTGILNMAALPLHLHTKKQPLADKHSPPDFHLPFPTPPQTKHRPSRVPSLWAQLLLNHEYIPFCPHFSSLHLLNLSFSSFILIYFYFISFLPPSVPVLPDIHFPFLPLALSSLPPR